MNNLYTYWYGDYSDMCSMGDIAYECFDAFDSGEYTRSEDDPKIDPAEKYTRKYIKELLHKVDNSTSTTNNI